MFKIIETFVYFRMIKQFLSVTKTMRMWFMQYFLSVIKATKDGCEPYLLHG